MAERAAEQGAPGFRWSTATADERIACAAGGKECSDCAAAPSPSPESGGSDG